MLRRAPLLAALLLGGCSSLTIARDPTLELKTSEAAPPAPAAGDEGQCVRLFAHVSDLALRWGAKHIERRILPGPPSREAFLRVCASLPEPAQACLDPAYDTAHHDACAATFGGLSVHVQSQVDDLFLAKPTDAVPVRR